MDTKHNKLKSILIEYGNPEYGDCIIDDISTLFGYPSTIDIDKVQKAVTEGLDCIIDECELHDENDEFFNIFLKELSEPIQFIAEGMSTGKIIKFNLTKTPAQLTADERHRVLEYNLGKNFPMNEVVTLRDIFMQDEFIEKTTN